MDTWGGSNHDPITLHKYLYSGADPINHVDPSGYSFILAFGGGSTNSILQNLSRASVIGKMKKVAAGLIGAGLGYALVNTDNPLSRFLHGDILSKDLERARAETKSKVEAKAKAKDITGKILYHYTTRAGAIAINVCRCLLSTVYKGPTVDGMTRPSGGYVTDISPWQAGATQQGIAQKFYGGNSSRVGRLGWFVAIDGYDFFPYGQPGEYVKPVIHPLQPVVSIDIITIGPNPMNLWE